MSATSTPAAIASTYAAAAAHLPHSQAASIASTSSSLATASITADSSKTESAADPA